MAVCFCLPHSLSLASPTVSSHTRQCLSQHIGHVCNGLFVVLAMAVGIVIRSSRITCFRCLFRRCDAVRFRSHDACNYQ